MMGLLDELESKRTLGKDLIIGDYVYGIGLILETHFDPSVREGFDVFKGAPYIKMLCDKSSPYGASYHLINLSEEFNVITDKNYLKKIFIQIEKTLHKSMIFLLNDINSLYSLRDELNIFDVTS
jgi:hypothetical protein